MQSIIDEMRKAGSRFNGVLNGGFFKTPAGIKFMEFNGRFGDPEGLNILSILETSFSDLLVHIWSGTLSDKAVSFAKKASVVKYLVAKEGLVRNSPNRLDPSDTFNDPRSPARGNERTQQTGRILAVL